MRDLINEVRQGLCSLRRQPAFTAGAVSTIALAITANTVVFAIVDGVLLKPLRLPDASSVLRVEERHEGRLLNLTGATLEDVAARSRTLAHVAGYRVSSAALTSGVEPIRVASAVMTPGYVSVLGIVPIAGRDFLPGDFTAGSRAVLIRERLWTTAFGRDPQLVGRTITLNARSADVIGILPESAFYPGDPDVFLPSDEHDSLFRNRRAHLFTTIARLAPSASLTSANAELTALSASITADSAETDGTIDLSASRLGERLTRSVRPAMLIVWAAVGMLLLIACANVAGLLLARAAGRRRDLAIRAALGCGRRRLLRYLALESALVGAAGGVIGVALAAVAVPLLRSVLPPSLPRAADVSVDWLGTGGRVVVVPRHGCAVRHAAEPSRSGYTGGGRSPYAR